jgi:hypothetical protein
MQKFARRFISPKTVLEHSTTAIIKKNFLREKIGKYLEEKKRPL